MDSMSPEMSMETVEIITSAVDKFLASDNHEVCPYL